MSIDKFLTRLTKFFLQERREMIISAENLALTSMYHFLNTSAQLKIKSNC